MNAPANAREAVLLALDECLTFAEAGRRAVPPISREAVRQAAVKLGIAKLARAKLRTRQRLTRARRTLVFVSVRLSDGRAVSLRATTAERDAWLRASGDATISEWLRGLLTKRPCPSGASVRTHLRRIADEAARL